MADQKIPAGDYEMVALLWDEVTSEPGKPFTFTRHRQGDIVTLNEEDARRLVLAGAVVEPGSIERARVAALKQAYEAALAALPAAVKEAGETAPSDEDDDSTDDTGVPEHLVPEHLRINLPDLRAYAGTNDIDLEGATLKADVLAKIIEAESK